MHCTASCYAVHSCCHPCYSYVRSQEERALVSSGWHWRKRRRRKTRIINTDTKVQQQPACASSSFSNAKPDETWPFSLATMVTRLLPRYRKKVRCESGFPTRVGLNLELSVWSGMRNGWREAFIAGVSPSFPSPSFPSPPLPRWRAPITTCN